MTTISTESNIDRAKKAIRSKFQHVMESRQQQKTIATGKSKPSNRQESPQRKVFETFFNGRARRALCFVRSKQQEKLAGVQDEVVKRLDFTSISLLITQSADIFLI
jgi:exonuclease I